MYNAHEIKGRIKGIQDTAQITRAMQLISASKLRKAMKQYESGYTHFKMLRSVMKDIVFHSDGVSHPYFTRREGNKVAFLVIAADKGFAGEFNKKVLDLAANVIKDYDEKFIFTVGDIASEYFRKQGIPTDIEFLHIAQNPTLDDARKLTYDILELYDNCELDEVKMIFTSMQGTTHNTPLSIQLLPLEKEDLESAEDLDESTGEYRDFYDFEPSPQQVFDVLAPQYVLGLIYGALVQSVAAEHFERMVAMKSAIDNADRMLKGLKLMAQRARQERITTELAEISSAAENLENR